MNHLLVRTIGLVLSGLALAGLVVACGSSDRKVFGVEPGTRGSIQACLENAGAKVGRSPSDLDFLAAAEADQAVSKPSFAYDKRSDVIVQMWTGAFDEGNQPSWMLWYGEPFGQANDPWQIVRQHPNDTFVLYVNRAPTRVVQRARNCITFDDEGHETRIPPLNSSAK